MPEYLAPGVYVEEVSFRSKSIEGVSTTTTGFVGPARFGPVTLEPDVITSLGEYVRIYGDGQQMEFYDESSSLQPPTHNYLWHGVRAFFEEGGKRLYVARVFRPLDGSEYPPADFSTASQTGNAYNDGHARGSIGGVNIRARHPGSGGNMQVRFTFRLGQNVLSEEPSSEPGQPARPRLRGVQPGDVVYIEDVRSPISPPGGGDFFLAERYFSTALGEDTWRFRNNTRTIELEDHLQPSAEPGAGDSVRVLTVAVTVLMTDGTTNVWTGLALDPGHTMNGAADSLTGVFTETPGNLGLARTLPLVISLGNTVNDGVEVLDALLTGANDVRANIPDPDSTERMRSIDVLLEGGNDGRRPGAAEYEGEADPSRTYKTGLKALEDIEDISIMAAPGATAGLLSGYADGNTIVNLLISHAARMRYRIAVLDSGDGMSIADVRAQRAKIDSTYAALYYPWVRILDPITRSEIHLPPSGFVCGIYARNDINRAVYKAPANEVVNLAIGFEQLLNKAQQDVLNPEGVNCFRFFEGRGFRLWGARTISSDPEWKYVNLRRYFAYLERSIDKGTQWAVFEPNGEALWANIRRTVEDFLLNEWQSGALLGDKPEKAFFVRCDRSTMTQNDLDNGRLICLIGVAPLRPAEFVIFRIGQWTADRRG